MSFAPCLMPRRTHQRLIQCIVPHETLYYSWTMSSSTFQSSNELSGKNRRMTRGIFLAASSLSAISSGSVSPSTGTRTGAFILV